MLTSLKLFRELSECREQKKHTVFPVEIPIGDNPLILDLKKMISLYSTTDKQLLSYDYWEKLWTHIPDSRREDANLCKKTAQF